MLFSCPTRATNPANPLYLDLIIQIVQTTHLIVTLSTTTVTEDSSQRKSDPPGIWSPSFRCSSLYLFPKKALKCPKFPADAGFLHSKVPLTADVPWDTIKWTPLQQAILGALHIWRMEHTACRYDGWLQTYWLSNCRKRTSSSPPALLIRQRANNV